MKERIYNSNLQPAAAAGRRLVAVIFSVMIWAAAARAEDKPYPVAVTIPPQAFFVSRIGGDAVDVETMIPQTADHETFEPTMVQLRRLQKSRLYFKIGHPDFFFEAIWLSKLLAESGNGSLSVVNMFKPADYNPGDIHVWLSVAGGRTMARSAMEQLSDFIPSKKAEFEQNYAALMAELDRFETELKSSLEARKRSSILVYHPEWGYLCRELGLTQLAIENQGKEPTPGEVAQVTAQAKSAGIRLIIADRHAPKSVLVTIAGEINGTVSIIDPMALDWLGNMKSAGAAIKGAVE